MGYDAFIKSLVRLLIAVKAGKLHDFLESTCLEIIGTS